MTKSDRDRLRWSAEDKCLDMSRAEMSAAILKLLTRIDELEGAIDVDLYEANCDMQSENIRLQSHVPGLTATLDERTWERDKALEETARLRSALEWYADRKNYDYGAPGPRITPGGPVVPEHGERARVALGKDGGT